MKIADARLYAEKLLEACDSAEKEGRDTINEADLKIFSEALTVASDTLGKTIAEAEKNLPGTGE